MAKRYDPIMCMMVDEQTKAQDAKYRVYYGMSNNQKSVIVEASSESEAAEKYAKSTKYPGTVHRVEKIQDSASTLDKAIRICDASTKVVVFVENYLRSIGKNNSTGKYDKIVQGVRSLLSQSLLDDEGLKKAAEHEADRLLKKYNL